METTTTQSHIIVIFCLQLYFKRKLFCHNYPKLILLKNNIYQELATETLYSRCWNFLVYNEYVIASQLLYYVELMLRSLFCFYSCIEKNIQMFGAVMLW